MKKLIFYLTLIIVSTSCKKQSKESFAGTYSGTFIRISPNVDYFPTTVNLAFSSDSFQGESGVARYPAICKGAYKISDQEIDFQNSCTWTADFDGTLILSGKFQIYKNDTIIKLSKHLDNNTVDTYELKKK